MALRRGIVAAALVGAAAWLMGCAGEQQPGANLEKVDPSGQKVRFWYQHADEREQALLALIADFNNTNEYGIEVIGEHAGNHDEIYEKMLLRMQGGPLPGLVVAYRYQAQHYYQEDRVVDLAPYMDSPRWGLSAADRADYFQEFLDQDRIRGVQVAFLPSRSMEIMYYNVDWLRELGQDGPPRTWDQFAALCRQAGSTPFSKATGGLSVGLALNVDASRLAAMVFSRGGDFINADGTSYTLDTPQVRASLQLLRSLVGDGAAAVMEEQDDVQDAFSAGRALFVIRSSSGMPLYRHSIAAGADFAWDVAPLPDGGGTPTLDVYGASLAVCHTTPEQQLAAWLFIKWFTGPRPQREWSVASSYFPVRRSTARDIASYFRISYDLLEHGQPEPWVVGYGAVRQMIEEAMADYLESGDADAVLGRLQAQANRTLQR